jgi:hypothetical protein
VDSVIVERSSLRHAIPLVLGLLVILFIASPGVKITIADQVYQSSWGTEVSGTMNSAPISKDDKTVLQGDTTYGLVTTYKVQDWAWTNVQGIVDKAVTDTVQGLNDKGYKPLYVHAQVENLTRNLLLCNFDIRITTQFHTPAKQQDVEILILIIIILILVALLIYFTYKGIADAVKFFTDNPVFTYGLLLAIGLFSAAIIAVVYFNRKKSSS